MESLQSVYQKETSVFFNEFEQQFLVSRIGYPIDVNFAKLHQEFAETIDLKAVVDSFELKWISWNLEVEEISEGTSEDSLESKIARDILKPLDSLSPSESFPSYGQKLFLVCLLLEKLIAVSSKEDSLSEIGKCTFTKEAWRICLRAAWTLHQQLILYKEKIDVHERFPDPEQTKQIAFDISQFLYAFLIFQQTIGLLIQCMRLWNTSFDTSPSKWSLQSSQDQVLIIDTCALLFLSKALVTCNQKIVWKEIMFKPTVQERDVQLMRPQEQHIFNCHTSWHYSHNFQIPIEPILMQNDFLLPQFLFSYLQPSSWISLFEINYIQPLESLLLQLLKKDLPPVPVKGNFSVRDYYEELFTSAHIAIAKHWDITENCITSDVVISHALLGSLKALTDWKTSLNVSSLMLSTSSLVAILPIVTRLFSDRFEEEPHVLSQWVLLQLCAHVTQYHLAATASDWLLPKLLLQLPIFMSELARLLCHRVLLSLSLSALTQHATFSQSADFPSSGSSTNLTQRKEPQINSGQAVFASLVPAMKGSKIPQQNQTQQQKIHAIQRAGEYLEQSCQLLQREVDPMVLWLRWIPLLRIIQYFPSEISQYYFAEINNVFLLGCNIWHIPFQGMLLQNVVPLLFHRCPSEMIQYTAVHLTEIFRVYLFYRSDVCDNDASGKEKHSVEVPDLSLADESHRSYFAQQIVRDRLWHGFYGEMSPQEMLQWSRAMRNQLEKSLAKNDLRSTLEWESCKAMLRCLEEISVTEG